MGFPSLVGCRRIAMASSAYALAKAVGEIVAGASEVPPLHGGKSTGPIYGPGGDVLAPCSHQRR